MAGKIEKASTVFLKARSALATKIVKAIKKISEQNNPALQSVEFAIGMKTKMPNSHIREAVKKLCKNVGVYILKHRKNSSMSSSFRLGTSSTPSEALKRFYRYHTRLVKDPSLDIKDRKEILATTISNR